MVIFTKKITQRLKTHWKVVLIIALVIVASSAVKMFASSQLGYLGDEPDDFANLSLDISKTSSLFDGVMSSEQSRLPHFIVMPFFAFAGDAKLFMARLVSLLAFNGFLIVFYLLLRLHLSRARALFGFIAVASSSFLFSYSFLAMTSSNSLYLFLSTLSMYVYLRQTKKGETKNSTQMAVLGLIFGLAMGAKLFGVILLAIVAFYDFVKRKQWKLVLAKRDIKKLSLSHQFRAVIIFYAVWLGVNIIPSSPAVKATLFVVILPLTVGYFIYSVVNEKFTLNSYVRWLYVTVVSGLFLILASPIYLNIKNVIGIFNWSEKWNSVNVIMNPSFFDPFITIGVKFGLVAGVLLSASLLILAYKKQLSKMLKEYGLLFLVFAVFLLIFLLVTNYFAWYPLVIFWILYIPFCYIFPEKIRRSTLSIIVALLLMLIPVYEVYRYAKIFPNGQTDGAQYGDDYVGWNKPGFITFEGLPLLRDYILGGAFNDEVVVAKCVLIPEQLDRYTKYVTRTINYYLYEEGVNNFLCLEGKLQDDYKYIATSNYTSLSFIATLEDDYVKQKEFYVNTVNVATLWVKKG